MQLTTLLVVTVLLGLVVYNAYPLVRAKRIARDIIPGAVPFMREDASLSHSILVLGDRPQETLAEHRCSAGHS